MKEYNKEILDRAMWLMAEYIRSRNPEFKDFPIPLIMNLYVMKALNEKQNTKS